MVFVETVFEGDVEGPLGFQFSGEPVPVARLVAWLEERIETVPPEHRADVECHFAVTVRHDVRISITYRRPETPEEREARLAREARASRRLSGLEERELKRLIALHPDFARAEIDRLGGGAVGKGEQAP